MIYINARRPFRRENAIADIKVDGVLVVTQLKSPPSPKHWHCLRQEFHAPFLMEGVCKVLSLAL